MPTIHGMDLPRPEHWQEFEAMTRDAMALRWSSPNLQMNGRSGQKQNGVDIWGVDDLGRPVGIQCKRCNPPLKFKTITDEVDKAEKFGGKLNTLFLATTADFDAALQQQVRVLSEQRAAAGSFALGLLFWKDVVGGLSMNPAVLKSHFPNLVIPTSTDVDPERQIAALEIGYFGGNLWEFVTLIHGEFGWMAQEDPDELTTRVRTVEHRAAQLLPTADASPLIGSCVEVRKGCLTPKSKKSDWDVVEMHAKRVEKRLRAASSLLAMEEGRALELGITLSTLYFKIEEWPQPILQANVERSVRALLPSSSTTIDATLAEASELRSADRWAARIFGLVDRELRWS